MPRCSADLRRCWPSAVGRAPACRWFAAQQLRIATGCNLEAHERYLCKAQPLQRRIPMPVKITLPDGRKPDKAFMAWAEAMLSDAGVTQQQADFIVGKWQAHTD